MTLIVGIHEQPKPVATFELSGGLNADIFPVRLPNILFDPRYLPKSMQDLNAWVMRDFGPLVAPGQFRLDSAMRLTFKAPASFWAFVYLTGGFARLPRYSLTGEACYMDDDDYTRFLSSETSGCDFPVGVQRFSN